MTATVTVDESRDRTIVIDGITKAEMNAVIEAGIVAVFGADLPADFALDTDDTLTLVDPGVAGTPTIYSRQGGGTYRISINETD